MRRSGVDERCNVNEIKDGGPDVKIWCLFDDKLHKRAIMSVVKVFLLLPWTSNLTIYSSFSNQGYGR